MHRALAFILVIVSLMLGAAQAAEPEQYRSHPPMRPLAVPSDRPLGQGPTHFVDAARGNDANPGNLQSPWKTIAHGLAQLKPGHTLCLRAGIYYENVSCTVSGTADSPITLRSFPGELAVIDGGFREFFENPAQAWEPFPGGAVGEYCSTRTYPDLAEEAAKPVFGSGVHSGTVKVLGNFADSLVPLHGYHTVLDLRSDNEFWNLKVNVSQDEAIYCGPGLWYNPETQRIHVRLAHTKLEGLAEDNYRGETDPRKLPLIIGGRKVVLDIEGAKHLRFQDLVLRGTRSRTVNISNAEDIQFDNLTVYGGAPAMFVEHTRGLLMTNCALRGVSAPWSFRTSEKYRGISTYLFIASGEEPPCQDFELANCEFTDCHDGLIIGTIDRLRFHHNLVDNFNDDGLYLTIGSRAGRDIRLYQNRLSRCLTTLSFAGEGTGQEGTEVYICRNVFDLRQPVHYHQARSADEPQEIISRGRTCSDHGSPIWKPMIIYHNTIINHDPAFRNYYAAGFGGHTRGTQRRLFNNIVVQVQGMPGLAFGASTDDIQADGNLHWSVSDGPTFEGDFFAAFRKSKVFDESQARYAPGWAAHDLFGDPKFVKLSGDWKVQNDYRLQEASPAINAGLAIPAEWFDPLRQADAGQPDIGAIPLGSEPWGVGVRGRIPLGTSRP